MAKTYNSSINPNMQVPYQPYQTYITPDQQQFVPKTAINELDSFMSGLTEDDRQTIFSTPEFAGMYGDFLNRFMFYLLQGDLGMEFVSSSASRREFAERLKLMAHNIYSANKNNTMSELERLQKENEALTARLRKQETKMTKVTADEPK